MSTILISTSLYCLPKAFSYLSTCPSDTEEWLAMNPISPVSREPIAIDQIEIAGHIQEIIDNRLLYHQGRLEEYLEASPVLQAALTQ